MTKQKAKGLKFSIADDGNATAEGCGKNATGALVIPADFEGHPVTSIGNFAFCGCNGLKSVTIPDSVTSIGVQAFEGCSGLKSVTIPGSVTSIGDGAFRFCSGLKSVTIPDSVTSIGQQAFYDCSGLRSVIIPQSVKLGRNAFPKGVVTRK